jgi:hypothetical protein
VQSQRHIPREGVGDWLADSALHTTTYHCTDPVSALEILERGVEIAATDPYAAWGQGFYSSTIPETQFGEAVVEVAVRLLQPLRLHDTVRGAEIIDELLARTGADDIRAAVLADGYDGVLIPFGDQRVWVVAYHDEQVLVVVSEP